MADLMHRIEGVILLDSEGKRVFCKYFGEPFEGKVEKQMKFEAKVFEKTQPKGMHDSPKEGGDIALVENHTVVFRLDPEVYFYVIGSLSENEVIVSDALCTVYASLANLLRSPGSIEKRQLLENFDLLVLVVDETFHDGIVLQDSSDDVLDLVNDHAAESQDAITKIKMQLKNQASSGKF
eukprot:TRINITY_DN65179_c0_g1_i1.p2 TRINITY_DN65179_c0_g1~~TRINITY_DN65179_c0_g1_i1.p2  ORF type:complete len:199 (+),score=95.01 TRINITY_DN65179_c0_g1_i1:58-597(+)